MRQEHRTAAVPGQKEVKGIALPEDSFVLDALGLADDAGLILGRRHWIWQLGLLYAIDLDLSLFRWTTVHARANDYHVGTAAAILEVWDWLGSLGLSQDPSLWLYQRAVRLLEVAASADCAGSVVAELQRRVDNSTPFVDLLGYREFVPE